MKRVHRFPLLLAVLCAAGLPRAVADNSQLAPISMGASYVVADGSDGTARLALVTYGEGPVEQFTYTLTSGGTIVASGRITPEKPVTRQTSGELSLPLPPAAKPGVDALTFTIDSVNGQPNSTTIAFTQVMRYTVTRPARRRVLVEEHGRLWCGYCPRGIAALSYLTRTYPDDCVAIAVHSGASPDDLSIDDYEARGALAQGFPTTLLNGEHTVGGVKGDLEFQAARSAGTPMDLDVSAHWDEQRRCIDVHTTTTFRLPMTDAPYALAYVLLHDSLTGYTQRNYYAGDRSELGQTPELDYFVNAPASISNLTQNHVPVAGLGLAGGLAGSLPATVEADRPLEHTVSFDNVDALPLVQNKDRLHVCAFIVERRTGRVANAAQCTIATGTTVGMNRNTAAASTRREVARLAADGTRLSAPQRGVNLVRYDDGTTRKELVR